MNKVAIPEEWKGWYFENDFLCTPEGDRFTQGNVRASQIIRQMESYKQLGEFVFYKHKVPNNRFFKRRFQRNFL